MPILTHVEKQHYREKYMQLIHVQYFSLGSLPLECEIGVALGEPLAAYFEIMIKAEISWRDNAKTW